MYRFHWQGHQQTRLNTKHKQSRQSKLSQRTLARSLFEFHGFCQNDHITVTTIIKRTRFWQTQVLSSNHLIHLFSQLCTLLNAGFPLLESLRFIDCPKQSLLMQYKINLIKAHILQGKSVSQSLKPVHEISHSMMTIMTAYEQAGKITQGFEQLSELLKKQQAFQRRLKKILLYPKIVLFSLGLLLTLMCLFVIPQFSAIYQQLNAPLPWITRVFIQLSSLVQTHCIGLLLVGMTLVFSFKWCVKRYAPMQRLIRHAYAGLPLLNGLQRQQILYRLYLTLHATLCAGIPLISALSLSFGACGCHRVARHVDLIIPSLKQGNTLTEAMAKTRFFTPHDLHLIHLGETSGKLDDMLKQLVRVYDAKLNRFVSRLQVMLEPFIMLSLGGIVGSIMVAMYLPIFQLGDHF